MGSEEFRRLKSQLLQEGRLYVDQEFQAVPKSVYFSKHNPYLRWRRPHEIVRDPRFVVEEASRFDLDQGALGDCWYIAASATLATHPRLYGRVIPQDQGFDKDNYAGIFRFNFWRYGKWEEVIIDDKLPVMNNKLYFCSNREQPNEFWSALLEKAYAKLHGCYEALEGGWTEDGLVDFTGGIGQRYDLKNTKKLPKNFFDHLLQFYNRGSMMGSCIFASATTMENVLDNGLVIGHAYSVTKMIRCLVNERMEELVRIRNPWGKTEWNGPWSDGSREWRSLDPKTREKMGLVNEEDGEFWMSFRDWVHNFEQMQICHLPPADVTKAMGKSTPCPWKEAVFHGKWVRGASAGGCGNPPNQHMYWTNPQYIITVTPSDPARPRDKQWIVVSLMQKFSRAMRSYTKSDDTHVPISFDLYKVKDNVPRLLEGENYSQHALTLTNRGGDYEYCRETTHTFQEEPGLYVVIPSTFAPNVERGFLLRVYTECGVHGEELDVETGPIAMPSDNQKKSIDALFSKYCGSDNVLDAQELQYLLNEAFISELGGKHAFDLEACRSLVCMMDSDKSGVLEFDEVKSMWTELTTWQNAFGAFDKDKSGYISVNELRTIFKSVGYNVSRGVLTALIRRYGGKEGKLPFDDFVIAMSKVISLIDVFSKVSHRGKAELTQEQFMQLSLGF